MYPTRKYLAIKRAETNQLCFLEGYIKIIATDYLPLLKAAARTKVCSRLVTLEVFHLETSELNKLASLNAATKEVTLDTSHLDISVL